MSICEPHQRSCLHTGLDIVESKHSPNGLKEEVNTNTLGFLVKYSCAVGLWMKGHLGGSRNLVHKQSCGPNKAPESGPQLESAPPCLGTFSPWLHRPKLACRLAGEPVQEARDKPTERVLASGHQSAGGPGLMSPSHQLPLPLSRAPISPGKAGDFEQRWGE